MNLTIIFGFTHSGLLYFHFQKEPRRCRKEISLQSTSVTDHFKNVTQFRDECIELHANCSQLNACLWHKRDGLINLACSPVMMAEGRRIFTKAIEMHEKLAQQEFGNATRLAADGAPSQKCSSHTIVHTSKLPLYEFSRIHYCDSHAHCLLIKSCIW